MKALVKLTPGQYQSLNYSLKIRVLSGCNGINTNLAEMELRNILSLWISLLMRRRMRCEFFTTFKHIMKKEEDVGSLGVFHCHQLSRTHTLLLNVPQQL